MSRVLRVPGARSCRDGRLVAAGGRSATPSVPLVYAGRDARRAAASALAPAGSPGRTPAAGRAGRQAAVAVHGVLLGRDLQQSRELLVSAREEERRRLRRDLHDGVGPSLAAVALQVETARDVYARRPGRGRAILDRAAQRLRAAFDDVRAVVHGLRPPTLDDLGLPGAVRELAARFDGPAGRSGSIGDVPGRRRRSTPRSTAWPRGADQRGPARAANGVAARAAPGPEACVLDCATTASGCPTRVRPGVGLRSMRERADELGGTLRHVRAGRRGTGASCGCRWRTDRDRAGARGRRPPALPGGSVDRLDGSTRMSRSWARQATVRRRCAVTARLPDVVLMDLHMPDVNGIEATRRIVAEHPRSGAGADHVGRGRRGLRRHARRGPGLPAQGAGRAEITAAIAAVARGEVVFSAGIASRVLAFFSSGATAGAPFSQLTEREREILDLVARGLTNARSPGGWSLSEKTVRNHVSNVFTKLQVTGRAEAVAKARDAGLGTGPV